MDNHLIYSEFFDRYLKGKLSESEQEVFEEKVRQDPLLSSEIKFQKEVFSALGEARKAALKTRLDQVPVNNTGWFGMQAGRWAAVVSAVLVITTGSYFYLSRAVDTSEKHIIDIDPDYAVTDNMKNDLPVVPAPVPNKDQQHQKSVDIASRSSVEVPEGSKDGSGEIPQHVNQEKTFVPDITRPDLVTGFAEDTQTINYQDFEAPEEKIAGNSAYDDAHIDIENIPHRQYNFHYQFIDHKLYLYGDFKGVPYKIIALNSEKDKRLFLEYNGHFYAISDEQKEIVPLHPIEDSIFLRKLNRMLLK